MIRPTGAVVCGRADGIHRPIGRSIPRRWVKERSLPRRGNEEVGW